jgi:hypothetical protein
MFEFLDRYEYLRPVDLAEWLGVTEAYIYKLRKHGVIQFKVINDMNYISTKSIKAWIEANTI